MTLASKSIIDRRQASKRLATSDEWAMGSGWSSLVTLGSKPRARQAWRSSAKRKFASAIAADLHDHQRPEVPRDAHPCRQVAQEPQGDISTLHAADYAAAFPRPRRFGASVFLKFFRQVLDRVGVRRSVSPKLEQRQSAKIAYPPASQAAPPSASRPPLRCFASREAPHWVKKSCLGEAGFGSPCRLQGLRMGAGW